MLYLDGNKHWQSLTNKRTGEFLAVKTSKEKVVRLNAMKSVLSLDETPSALERYYNAATNLVVNYQQIKKWKVYPWKIFCPWPRIFILRHEKHREILTLTCENF